MRVSAGEATISEVLDVLRNFRKGDLGQSACGGGDDVGQERHMMSRRARDDEEVAAAMVCLYPAGTLVKWRFGEGKIQGNPHEFPAGAKNPWRVRVLVDATNEGCCV